MSTESPPIPERLLDLVVRFRKAIEEAGEGKWGRFQSFPSGSCGDASLLLGEWLFKNGMGRFDYVCAWRGNQSHAWLERDGILVDITADQFGDVEESVVVTRDPAWYSEFEETNRHISDISMYDERTTTRLRAEYQRLLDYLD